MGTQAAPWVTPVAIPAQLLVDTLAPARPTPLPPAQHNLAMGLGRLVPVLATLHLEDLALHILDMGADKPHPTQAWEDPALHILAWEDQVLLIQASEDPVQHVQAWEDRAQHILEWVPLLEVLLAWVEVILLEWVVVHLECAVVLQAWVVVVHLAWVDLVLWVVTQSTHQTNQ